MQSYVRGILAGLCTVAMAAPVSGQTLKVPSDPNRHVHYVAARGHCDGYMRGGQVEEQCDYATGKGSLSYVRIFSTTARDGVVKQIYFADEAGHQYRFNVLPAEKSGKAKRGTLFSNDPIAIEAQKLHTSFVNEIKETQK